MAHRFSFDGDDEDSFAPRHTDAVPQHQYHSARGHDYGPPSPPQHTSYNDHSGAPNLIDSSPTRGATAYQTPSTFDQAQRDPHDMSAVPAPPPHRRMSSSDSYGRGGYGVAPGSAAAGVGAGAVMDTAYHGSRGDHDDYESYNPFENAEHSHMPAPTNPYPEYPQHTLDDPFASHRNSYNNLAPPSAAYEMQQQQPGVYQRPTSFHSPYGSYDHAASGGDLGAFDPRDIADEDDDTGALAARQKRRAPAAAGVAGAAGAAAGAGAFVKGMGSRDASGAYNSVPGGSGPGGEKGGVVAGKASNRKRTLWIIGAVIAVIIVLAVVGGVVGSYVYQHKNGGSGPDKSGGDYDKDSKEIKALLNNKDLHKVFNGMAYVPNGAQYPECLDNPVPQNNVTMDVAIMSQLTPQLRLYGTDCQQTEMVLTAIDRLGLKDEFKIWVGAYLMDNKTTNDRQLAQMWDILDKRGTDYIQGVVVGNEVLFNEYMTEQELGQTLDDVKKNLTAKNHNLPLGTSDLGSKWTEQLASHVDYVMANVHPFFGGVQADKAASWTYSYWQDNDIAKTNHLPGKTQVVSEIGWPSGGGNDCTDPANGMNVPCPDPQAGAVSGIDNMNRVLDDWVCPALTNGTNYFYFEAFDVTWQAQFNKPGAAWEDKWGLMDAERKLKDGVKIPDCGGKTASLPK